MAQAKGTNMSTPSEIAKRTSQSGHPLQVLREHNAKHDPVVGIEAILKTGTLYLAYDRFVCASPSCAGSTALATGYTIGGAKVTKVTARDIAEWPADLGPLACECGKVTA